MSEQLSTTESVLETLAGTANGASPDVSVSNITPRDAAIFLGRNIDNRNIRMTRVEQYATDMKAGEWRLNGSTVVFDEDMNLLDGQHRLLACIEADVSFKTLIVRGVGAEAKAVIDTGMKRTVADVLTWKGETDCNNLSALLRLVWRIRYDETTNYRHPTTQECIHMFDADPEGFRHAIRAVRGVYQHTGLRIAALGAVYYLTAQQSQEDADAFVELLNSGANLPERSPVLALQKWASTHVHKREAPTTIVQAAVIMKAINLWREGRGVRALIWRAGGANAESFPAVWKDDGRE